jgi:redox-sensitive bicupin YhaK (pirin superfamily)
MLSQVVAAVAVGGLGCTRSEGPQPVAAPTSSRRIARALSGMPTSDGAGVRLTRVIGQPKLRNLDPFLMLDRFHSDDPDAYIAGFPDHPHRGFETVTVMLDGRMRHKDSRGNSGLIGGGGIQWMTAGRGIVHSEMPEQERGLMSGFQLWVNLPRAEKMTEPFYQDVQPEKVPRVSLDGKGEARVVSGDLFGARGPVRDRPSAPLLAHVTLRPGHRIDVPTPMSHTAFVFVGGGTIDIEGRTLGAAEVGVLERGERVVLTAGERGASLLLAAGKPFGEPIVQSGPFVMSTEEEIQRAYYDYRHGTLGRD